MFDFQKALNFTAIVGNDSHLVIMWLWNITELFEIPSQRKCIKNREILDASHYQQFFRSVGHVRLSPMNRFRWRFQSHTQSSGQTLHKPGQELSAGDRCDPFVEQRGQTELAIPFSSRMCVCDDDSFLIKTHCGRN